MVRTDFMEVVYACPGQESLVHLLIAAAGSGRRMGADRNKLLLPLAGRPVIAWTLEAALRSERIEWIGIVGQEVDRDAILSVLDAPSKPVRNGFKGAALGRSRFCVVWRDCRSRPAMS